MKDTFTFITPCNETLYFKVRFHYSTVSFVFLKITFTPHHFSFVELKAAYTVQLLQAPAI